MGLFKSIKKIGKTVGKIAGFAAPWASKLSPLAPYALAGYALYQGVSSYHQGKKARRFARREGELAMQQAEEYNQYLLDQGNAASAAAAIQASAASKQAHALRAAAHAARALGEKNAQYLLEEGEETVGRMKKEHRSLESEALARMAASGIQAKEGTPKKFRKILNKENRNERQWVEQTFKHNAEVAREGGEIDAKQLSAAAAGAGAGAHAAMIEGQMALSEARMLGQQALDEARLYGEELKRKTKKGFLGGFGGLLKGIGMAGLTLYGAGVFGKGGGFPVPRGGSFGSSKYLPSPSGNRGAI